jgi:hypothetical protein
MSSFLNKSKILILSLYLGRYEKEIMKNEKDALSAWNRVHKLRKRSSSGTRRCFLWWPFNDWIDINGARHDPDLRIVDTSTLVGVVSDRHNLKRHLPYERYKHSCDKCSFLTERKPEGWKPWGRLWAHFPRKRRGYPFHGQHLVQLYR